MSSVTPRTLVIALAGAALAAFVVLMSIDIDVPIF